MEKTTTDKKNVVVEKKVEVKTAPKAEKRFPFKFIGNTLIGWTVFAKDTIINLTEEELKIYRPYVCCPEKTPIKQPCKRC